MMNEWISDKNREVISRLLFQAAESFSQHGCNDISRDIEELFNQEEMDALNKKLNDFNNSPDEYEAGEKHITGGDWFLMAYYSHLIKPRSATDEDITD